MTYLVIQPYNILRLISLPNNNLYTYTMNMKTHTIRALKIWIFGDRSAQGWQGLFRQIQRHSLSCVCKKYAEYVTRSHTTWISTMTELVCSVIFYKDQWESGREVMVEHLVCDVCQKSVEFRVSSLKSSVTIIRISKVVNPSKWDIHFQTSRV